jgi:hypothetical protein
VLLDEVEQLELAHGGHAEVGQQFGALRSDARQLGDEV